MRKLLFLALLSLICILSVGQVVFNYRYWFDGRHEEIYSGVSTDSKWSFEADVSELDVGFHSIYLQVDTSGVFSSPIMKYFFKSLNNNIVTTYWFDGDYKNSQELSTNFVDVSPLSEGIHSISFLANDNGIVSGVTTKWFIKTINCSSDDMTCVCLIDDNEYSRVKVSSSGGLINFDFDVSSLSQGLHKMQLFCITSSGTITDMKESIFLRTPTTEEIQSFKCYYSIDNSSKNGYLQAGSYNNGLFHFDIDVSELQDGLHQITCFLANDNGVALGQNTSFFLKTPLGGNGITHWEYWINDSDAAKQTTLNQATSSLQIISLLPIESVPIRSSCFEFKIENDKPVIYAKNDIKFRFFDKSGRMTEISKQYVDINVSQNLEPEKFPKLKTNDVTNITRPTDNEIKWYKFEGEEGELAKFCMDKACGLDVYTPSGEKFYSVSGAESVKEGEDNLPETGTYYVAVHDMTAQYGSSLNLTFTLIDKYAVLEQNVKTVGNGGLSSIKFNGNGYYELDSISISNQNTTIKHYDIKYKSNTEIETAFDFSGAEPGHYDITLHFTDDNLILSNALAVETAEPIKLESNVDFESQYLVGTDCEYKATIKNRGNMTAYKVPIFIYIETPITVDIPPIKMNGLDLPGVLDDVDLSEFTNSQIYYLQSEVATIGDGLHFNKFKTVSPETGDSILVQSNYFFVEVPPHSNKTFTIAINTEEVVSCYVTTPEEWLPLTVVDNTNNKAFIKAYNSASDWYCCYKERVECVLTVVGNVSDLVSMCVPEGAPASVISDVVSCASSTLGNVSTYVGTAICNKEEVEKNLYDQAMAASNAISAVDYIKDCLLTKLKDKFTFGKVSEIWNIISKLNNYTLQHVDANISCISSLLSKKPNCPPIPPKGGTSTPTRPCEPNEMHGYTSESGSTFINGDVTDVFYSIESENDPEIATAAAHTIVVTDTIDGRYHDLSSFAATKVSLGKVSMKLNGEKEFVKTMDLRPLLDVIAQVELKYDESTGIAQWIVTSLDPMTMEPTKDVMQGALPVNDEEGNGIGFFDYDIKLKKGLKDGTEIKNRASIIFDTEEPIITPYWVNTVDSEKPESKVDKIECIDDTTVTLRFKGKDNRSGIWRYKLYVQPGAGSEWYVANENLYQDSCDYKVFRDIDYGFCVVATDSAGNVESKPLEREISYVVYTKGDANGDGIVDSQDVVLAINKYLDENTPINFIAADINEDDVIDSQDIVAIQNIFLKREDEYFSSTRKRKLIRHNKNE